MKIKSVAILLCLTIGFCSGCNKEKETIIVLARHAQTTANVTNTLAGRRGDVGLTLYGYKQAEALGDELLDKYVFDSFYCSSLTRTQETGKTALNKMGLSLEPHVDSGLDDVDYGLATGLTVQEASLLYGGTGFPSDFGPIDDESFKPTFTEENTYSWYKRFQSSLDEIGKKEKGHQVLVVSHGACFYWGQYTFGEDKVTGFSNCSYAELSFKNGNWSLVSWHPDAPIEVGDDCKNGN